jgi:hypothetical protein
MAKINGVEVGSISKIMGREVSSITNIMGIKTSEIPDWPGQTPTCESLRLGYQPTPPIATVCTQEQTLYDFNPELQLLYTTCNTEFAPAGFYSDGRFIYKWVFQRGRWFWENIGECPREFNGPWFNTVFAPSFFDSYAIPNTTYDGFRGVQDGTPGNSIYAYVRFTIDSRIVDGVRNLSGEIYKYDVLEYVNDEWIQATDWRTGDPITDGGYTLDKGGNRETAINFRQVYDPNIGFSSITWEYDFGYATNNAYNGTYFNYGTPFTNQFNQRVFKILLYPIWEDDTSYYEIIINAGDSNNNPYVISQTSYYQGGATG